MTKNQASEILDLVTFRQNEHGNLLNAQDRFYRADAKLTNFVNSLVVKEVKPNNTTGSTKKTNYAGMSAAFYGEEDLATPIMDVEDNKMIKPETNDERNNRTIYPGK